MDAAQPGPAPSLKEIAAKFPAVAALVQAYGASFGSDATEQELFEREKDRAFQYEKGMVLRSPLRHAGVCPAAHAGCRALEAITKVEATDTDIGFPESPALRRRGRLHAASSGLHAGISGCRPADCDTRWRRSRAKAGAALV